MKIAVDASALLAILLEESDAEVYLAKLVTAAASGSAVISPLNWWEVQVRMRSKHGEATAARSAAWIKDIGLVIEPVTATQAALAVEAFTKYKGRPARLNMGDCFAYALAQAKGVPLLYKGRDFEGTDVEAA